MTSSPTLQNETTRNGANRSLDVTRWSSSLGVLRTSLRAMGIAGALGVMLGLWAGDPTAVAAAGVLASAAPPLLWLLRRGRAQLAMASGVSVLLATGCYVLIHGHGIHDVGLSLFACVLVVSALLLDRTMSKAFALLALVTVTAIGSAEATGLLETKHATEVSAGDVLVVLLILSSLAWLVQRLAQAFFRSLHDAYVSEQTYREIFNATTDGILIADPDTGYILDANQQAETLMGRSREDLLDSSLQALSGSSETVPLRDVVQGRPHVSEWRAQRGDGSLVWFEVALRAATISEKSRLVAAVRDISERKAAAEQLLASERMQAIGHLAGGVAHDFNNQLTAILTSASALRHRLGEASDVAEPLDSIIQCSNRAADLTKQLLAFARRGEQCREVVDVDALVDEVVSLLERSIDKRIEIRHVAHARGRALVDADPGLLQNALLNLGLNARDAMPDGGTLTFETQRTDNHVRAVVADTGHGMDTATAGRIFEPFFTTKTDGNGMGLAATYGTVRAHGGSITAQSEPGQGTAFTLQLPATDREPSLVRRPSRTDPLPPLRVLLAEDETQVARSMILLLEMLGCGVTHFPDGRSAWRAVQADPDAFDVAVLDDAMPHLRGRELATRISELRPRLPIIATSGFDEEWPDGVHPAHRIVLPKPFEFEHLRNALQRAATRREPPWSNGGEPRASGWLRHSVDRGGES